MSGLEASGAGRLFEASSGLAGGAGANWVWEGSAITISAEARSAAATMAFTWRMAGAIGSAFGGLRGALWSGSGSVVRGMGGGMAGPGPERTSMIRRSGLASCEVVTSDGPARSSTTRVTPRMVSATRSRTTRLSSSSRLANT